LVHWNETHLQVITRGGETNTTGEISQTGNGKRLKTTRRKEKEKKVGTKNTNEEEVSSLKKACHRVQR
jgi:hypothetical protein